MTRRPRRSIPAIVVAAVLLAICVLVVVAVLQSLLGHTPFLSLPQLLAVSSSQQWSSPTTVAAAVVIAVLGLVLLAAALSAGRPTVLPLAGRQTPDGRPGAEAGVRRRSLVTDLTTCAGAVAGVTHVDVTAGRGLVTARVRVAAADPAAVPGEVRERLEARIAEIDPLPRPRVRVSARADTTT